ncbi:hypothetical protein DFAR_3800046 [Desulfarculales bacterium]
MLALVPLHFRQLWRRGFNQSLLLVQAMASGSGPPNRSLLAPACYCGCATPGPRWG